MIRTTAAMYAEQYPQDTIITGDAHQYLLDHHLEFDFIWSSPPCQTHTRMRIANIPRMLNARIPYRYPDLSLYEEIIFLENFAKCQWVIENVVSYYPPLIRPQKRGRHYFWTNFTIPDNRGICRFRKRYGMTRSCRIVWALHVPEAGQVT